MVFDAPLRAAGDISAAAAPGNHCVPALDGAGWHRSKELRVPENISLLRLPPCSPERNPLENALAFLKDNVLSNQLFASTEDVRHAPSAAFDNFALAPDTITSIMKRSWAKLTDGNSTNDALAQVKTELHWHHGGLLPRELDKVTPFSCTVRGNCIFADLAQCHSETNIEFLTSIAPKRNVCRHAS